MKLNLKAAIFAVAMTFVLFAFAPDKKIENHTAQVDQVQGLYVFIHCKPLEDYKVLGSVKGPTFGSPEMDKMLEYMVERVKKQYPQANGIWFDGRIAESQNTTVTAIQF